MEIDNNISQKTMIQEGVSYVGENLLEGEVGYIDPRKAKWVAYKSYPVSRLVHLLKDIEEWKCWWAEEKNDFDLVRGSNYFKDLYDNPIEVPICISEIDGKGYIWDGWHRVAACIVSGKAFIPAYVALHK